MMKDDNFENILKNLHRLPDFILKFNKILSEMEISGESGAGLVKVVLNGQKDLLRIKIDESLLKEDRRIVENLISSAIKKTNKKINIQIKSKLASAMQDMGFPESFISMLPFINNK